ncbi:MAG TPA: ABC transporter ATP-binding protein [Candidatus Dormibacteraeota bacterium]|nr:ABC transporter ATP-binding protein [Candidatus Dormibacteraeota bacterium]
MSLAPAISITSISKSYGQLMALEDLDLSVADGELVAILGPNGAGKTTTVEILEGYRRQDRGQVSVLGLDPWREARRLRPQVGLMLQEGGIYPTLKVRESLTLFASFFDSPTDPRLLLERVGLEDRAGARFRQLSGGEKQRLSLALALVGRPRLLFLDEPTSGMDPRARLLTWGIIEEAQRSGTTVVLTTHSMEEAERLADRVAILNRGSLVAFDSPARLRGSADSDLIHIELAADLPGELLERMGQLAEVERIVTLGAGTYDLHSSQPRLAAAAVTRLLQSEGPQLTLLRLGRSSLEEVFLQLTDGSE